MAERRLVRVHNVPSRKTHARAGLGVTPALMVPTSSTHPSRAVRTLQEAIRFAIPNVQGIPLPRMAMEVAPLLRTFINIRKVCTSAAYSLRVVAMRKTVPERPAPRYETGPERPRDAPTHANSRLL